MISNVRTIKAVILQIREEDWKEINQTCLSLEKNAYDKCSLEYNLFPSTS